MEDFMYLQQEMEAEEEMDNVPLQAVAAAMVIFFGAEQSCLLQMQRHQPSQLYLCLGFGTGNPWVGISHTIPVPAYTAPVVGMGTYRPIISAVCHETCGAPFTCNCPHSY
jgi:hypothetical protein